MIDYKAALYNIFNFIWIIIILVVGYYIYENAVPVLEKIVHVRYGYLLLGIITGMLFSAPSVWILDDYLRKYNPDKGMAASCFLMFVPAIGKYVPGKIWVTGSFIIHARKLVNMPADDVLVFQVYYQILGVSSTLLLLLAGYIYGHESFYSIGYLLFSVFIIAAFFALVFYFRKQSKRIRLDIHPAGTARHLVAITLQKISRGVSLIIFILAFVDVPNYMEIFYAYIIAMQAGVLAFFAPAGLGVTEGTYMVVLSTAYGAEFAILIALISRLWSTVIDFLLAVTGLIVKRIYFPAA